MASEIGGGKMANSRRLWKRLFRKMEIHTIRTKLIISYLLIALLPLVIMAIFSYKVYYGSLTDKISQYSLEVVNRMTRDLDEYFLDIEAVLTKEQDFYIDQFIKLAHSQDFNNRKYTFRIWEDLDNLSRVKPGLEEIGLVFSDGSCLSNYGLYSVDYAEFRKRVEAALLPRGIAILGPRANFLNKTVICMVRPYPAPAWAHEVFLVAGIDLERLAMIANVKLGKNSYIFLANSQGEIIYHPEVELIGDVSPYYFNGQYEQSINQKNGIFLTTAYSEVTGLNVVSVAYADEVEAELAAIRNFTFLVVGLIILGVIFLAVYLSHALSRPIQELQAFTRRAANNELSVHIETKGKDEIAQLGHSFNKMMSRIQDLMSENVEEQKLLRKLEMESLDNQIKPHFIYNTLDLIIGQLESNNTSQASYLIEALGSFFRLSLSQGREIVPIASEVEHVRNYLFIQKLRHGEEYQYAISIDDYTILENYIPRLLLQPLVENAIYHGILRAQRKGKITITARRVNGDIHFEIHDDGQGIRPDKLRDLNEVLRGTRQLQNDKEYFGLRNVNKRAQLMFGEEYGVFLKSTYNEGTTAILKIKALDEDPNLN